MLLQPLRRGRLLATHLSTICCVPGSQVRLACVSRPHLRPTCCVPGSHVHPACIARPHECPACVPGSHDRPTSVHGSHDRPASVSGSHVLPTCVHGRCATSHTTWVVTLLHSRLLKTLQCPTLRKCRSDINVILGLVLLLLLLSLSLPAVYGLECYACHDLKTKFRCMTTQICNSGEVCLVQKVYSTYKDQFEKEQTSIYYNMACKPRTQCLNEYSRNDLYNVKSRYLSACCCTERCLEEDGTGYGDYSNCYNALTYEEAVGRTSGVLTIHQRGVVTSAVVLGVIISVAVWTG